MTDNDFDKLLKHKLEHFEADVPSSCWDAISQALPAERKPRTMVLWQRMAVAAVLVLGVSLAGFLFLKNSNNPPLVAKTEGNSLTKRNTQSQSQSIVATETSLPTSTLQKQTNHRAAVHHSPNMSPKTIAAVDTEVIVPQTTGEPLTNSALASNQPGTKSEEVEVPAKATEKELEAFINAGVEAQKQDETPIELHKKDKNSSLALLAGLPTVSHSSSDNEFHPLRSAKAFDEAYNILAATGETPSSSPFQRRHSIPFSLGLIIGKEVFKNTTIETGLHYTYLRSEQLQSETLNEIQKLYYLGIPLSITYKYANLKRFSFYVKAGGMAEKNVAGKWIGEIKGQTLSIAYTKTDNKLEETLQWSIHTGIGINYRISGMFNFYLEPSYTYFPDNGSEYQNIRKKEKFELSLQGGLRATFASK